MQTSDFNYTLPEQLIASYPLPERSASRLLCLDGATGTINHRYFTDLPELLHPADLLVFNNTQVIPARLFGKKDTGGQVEILIERILDQRRVLALIRSSKSPRQDTQLWIDEHTAFTVLARHGDLYELRSDCEQAVLDVIEAHGQIPLPPYFQREPEESDQHRYQTIYAEHKGSVAAPTAGLHFDAKIFAALTEKNIEMAYLTLHVGAGTFLPVRVEQIDQHRMHHEYIDVSADLCAKVCAAKARGGRIIAVGTTSARSLETASLGGTIKPFSGTTDIFIYPGFSFQCVDAMITNFHAPATTLLMLVSAFSGYKNIMQAYEEAVNTQYRFFSYGDAMFLSKK